MKFIAVVLVALAMSAQADESEYNNYQTHYEHGYEQQPDPYAGYSSDLTSAYTNSVSEKNTGYQEDALDMDVILPIVVFGGLGIGALAYVDSLNRMNNLCNKLKDVTKIARTNAAGGTATANLVAAGGGGITAAIATNVNLIIESNKAFINALALISDLDC